MLPSVESLEAYRLTYRNVEVWLPALEAICQQHGLDKNSLRQAPPGSHVVFWVEQERLIKLFSPLWRADAAKERLALRALASQGDFNAPRIVAEGMLKGWPYLILTRLPGTPLDEIWETLSPAEKETIATDLGQLMAAFHRLPTTGLETLLEDWPAFLDGQIVTCVQRQAQAGASAAWIAELSAFLADLPPLFEAGFQPVFLNADLNPEHLFCEKTPEGWRITGVIDFGDVMLGHPYYEFIAPGFITRNAPALRRAMLLAYGFVPHELNESLSRCMMAYTLLHRFADLTGWLRMFGEKPPANLAALQDALWGF